MTLRGREAFKTFPLTPAVSDQKFRAFFLALCNLPLIAFFLYRNGSIEDQWTGYTDFLTKHFF